MEIFGKFLFRWVMWGVLLGAAGLSAAEPPGCEAVELGGIRIICLRQGVGSFSAADRARRITERLRQLADDYSFSPEQIAVVARESGEDIMARDMVLTSLRPGDLELADGQTHGAAVQLAADRARSAIEKDRSSRRPETLARGVLYSLLATAGLAAALLALRRASGFLRERIRIGSERYVSSLKIQSYEILNARRVNAFFSGVLSVAAVLLTLIALYIYVPLVFSFFPWTEKWTPKLFEYILNPVRSIARVTVNYLPSLFYVIVIAIFFHYVLKVIRFVFDEIGRGALQFKGFHREWADPTYKLVRVLVIAMAFVMAFPYLPGSSSPAFQGVSVFLGLLVSFGSSSAISNIVSGIVITYMRPFKTGDRVRIADTMGDIVEKNLLVTRIRSIKNVEITIPNSMVLGSHIVNYSTSAREQGLILHTTVTIGYDVPWKQVHELLAEAARRTSLIDQAKKPFVLQTALNDFAVAYELNAYTAEPNRMIAIYSELHQNIQDCFNEAGVEIMSPHYTALRDGNEITVPAAQRAADYQAPGFRISR